MEKVLGFGGFFFRAADPAALARWYAECLGVDPVPGDYATPPWQQLEGPTVFAPFPQDSDYFGDPAKTWMLNFRVRNLDAMVRQLRGHGVVVEVDPEIWPNGIFARFLDPEGNPVAIWEPQVNPAPAP